MPLKNMISTFLTFFGLFSEYDFYTFNTVSGGGNVTVTTYVAPTLNALGADRRLKLAVQVDSLDPAITQFIPDEVPGSVPPGWDGLDGFVVSIKHPPAWGCPQITDGLLPGKQHRVCGQRDARCSWRPYAESTSTGCLIDFRKKLKSDIQIWMIEPTVIVEKIVIGKYRLDQSEKSHLSSLE
jgi:hypothetical protein